MKTCVQAEVRRRSHVQMNRLNCGAFVEPTQPPSCPNIISASDWSGHSLPSVPGSGKPAAFPGLLCVDAVMILSPCRCVHPAVCALETPGLLFSWQTSRFTLQPFVAARPTFLKNDSKAVSVSALDVLPLCVFR